MRTNSLGYRADIDGLRAFAVLPVVIYHAFPDQLRAGFLGVDVFFVISGFLITGIILDDLERGTFTFRRFYARRVRRILPALLLVCGACALFGALYLTPEEYANLGRHLLGAATFSSNFVLYSETGYFDISAWEKVLLHLWSLAIEEQFYLFWPIVLLVIYTSDRYRTHILCGLLLLSFVAYVAVFLTSQEAAFFISPLRFWEIFAGCLIAFKRRPRGSGVLDNVIAVIAFLLLIVAYLIVDENDPSYPVALAMTVVCAVTLIWLGPQNLVARAILSRRPFVFIGLISYPLYLWHWPILSFLRIGDGGGSVNVGVGEGSLALGASLILALATYHFIEKKIRFHQGNLVIPGLGLGLAGIAAETLWYERQDDRPYGPWLAAGGEFVGNNLTSSNAFYASMDPNAGAVVDWLLT